MKINRTRRGRRWTWALLAAALLACGGDGNADTDMLDGSLGDGGLPEGSTSEGGQDAAAPILDVQVSANPQNPLSVYVDVRADVPVTVEIDVDGPGLSRTVVGSAKASSKQSLALWGMRAKSRYTLTVHAQTAQGDADSTVKETYDTPALPDDFPPITVSGTPGPGYTLFNVFRWNPTHDSEWGLLLIVDEAGEVVWFHRDTPGPGDARMLDDGHILYAADNEKIVEIDMMGETIVEHTADSIGVDTIHHEVFPLPQNDHLLFLSTALHLGVPGYMDADSNPISEDIVSDVVVEIDADGGIVHQYDVFDLIDPLRTRDGFMSPFWTSRYGDSSDAPRDWTHGNAVIYDEADDTFIVSLRHQNWLLKVDRDSGDLLWRFGEDGDFTLDGSGTFQNHEHAPELLADGRLLMFDNGNASQQSRAVIFSLDEKAMTATQDWVYEDGSFAPFVGDADMLDSGNILVAFGGLVDDPSLALTDPANLKSARIVEVTSDADPQVLWELDVTDDSTSDPIGYTVYRAERLQDLYP